MTWTEPEVALAEQPMVQFRFGSLTEETDYDYEVSLDPTFSSGVFGGQFRTQAQQNNVDLASIELRGEQLDLSGYDLSADYTLVVQQGVVRGDYALMVETADAAATAAVEPAMQVFDEARSYPFTITVTNGTSSRVYNLTIVINAVYNAGDIDVGDNPRGFWSNGERLWIADPTNSNPKFDAYDLLTGVAVPAENIDFPAGAVLNNRLFGLASDGLSMFTQAYIDAVGNEGIYEFLPGSDTYARIRALDTFHDANDLHYRDNDLWSVHGTATPQLRLTRRNAAGVWAVRGVWQPPAGLITTARGIWGDAERIWIVADTPEYKVFCFTHSGVRVPDRDFDLAAENMQPWGLWSDGFTAWVGDTTDDKLYAYGITSGRPLGDLAPPAPPVTGADLETLRYRGAGTSIDVTLTRAELLALGTQTLALPRAQAFGGNPAPPTMIDAIVIEEEFGWTDRNNPYRIILDVTGNDGVTTSIWPLFETSQNVRYQGSATTGTGSVNRSWPSTSNLASVINIPPFPDANRRLYQIGVLTFTHATLPTTVRWVAWRHAPRPPA